MLNNVREKLLETFPAIQIVKSASREEWRKGPRRLDVTASRIGVLVDPLYPNCTRYSYWAEKCGLAVPDDDLDSAAMQRGRRLEKLAAEMAAEELPAGSVIEHNIGNTYWRDPVARIGATPDLIVQNNDGKGIVQLKSVEPTIFSKKWIDGEPPLWIALQAMTEAMLVGATWAKVGVLRVGHGIDFDLIDIPLREGVWRRLRVEVANFWASVESKTAPAIDYARDGATIALLSGDSNGSTIDLSHDNELAVALADREELKELQKGMAAQIAAHDALIRHKAGEAETIIAGEFRVSLRTESVKAYAVPARTQRPIRAKRIRGIPKT